MWDNDGQTQTSVSWAGRPSFLSHPAPLPPPPPLTPSTLSSPPLPGSPFPGLFELLTVDAAASAFACRSAAL